MRYKYDTIYKLNKISKPIKILVIVKIWFHVIYNIASLPKIHLGLTRCVKDVKASEHMKGKDIKTRFTIAVTHTTQAVVKFHAQLNFTAA